MTLQHLFFDTNYLRYFAASWFVGNPIPNRIIDFPHQEYYSFVLGNITPPSGRNYFVYLLWGRYHFTYFVFFVPFIRQIPLYLFSNSPSRPLVAETYYTFRGGHFLTFFTFFWKWHYTENIHYIKKPIHKD